jgi:hypothetical protein
MYPKDNIPLPLLFNPLKHHLCFIKDYISDNLKDKTIGDHQAITKDLKHLGGSLMDIYSGPLSLNDIFEEILEYLNANNFTGKESYSKWTGKDPKDFKSIRLSDDSQWILKFFNNEQRYIHLFPARYSPHSFRVKANTLKSAILYIICIGKDFVTEDDLNTARAVSGLSPVKEVFDAEAITEMIEILRAPV